MNELTNDELTYDVISADSHVIEPYDLWDSRLPAQLRDRAPRLVHEADKDVLVCEGTNLPAISMLAGCYRDDDDQRWNGRWDEDVPLSAYDPDVRLVDIARDGVDAEVLFPTLGMNFFQIDEFEVRWALYRAYNDWLAEVFCVPHPGRFLGIGMVDCDDVATAVTEMARMKGLGLAGVMIPMYSGADEPYWHERYDPLWAASIDLDLPINLHLLTSREKSKKFGGGMPSPGQMMQLAAGIQPLLVDMIAFGVFDRFPDLVVVSAENDAGWAAHLIEANDFKWRRVYKLGGPRSTHAPSHYFHHNIRMTFMRDRAAILAREIIGTHTMMWGNDFPHSTATWPHSKEVLDEHFHDQPVEVRNAIVRDNVRALYRF
jgi:predicted TIM-barrel fold metal-dependent hydrolase